MAPADELVGRDRERAALSDLLDSASTGAPQSLVLTGEPGVGKSALLAHIESQAALTWTVLRCTALPLEQDVPFTGLRQLLRPVLERLDDLLQREHAAALRAALAIAPASPGGRLGVATACLELFASLSRERPTMVTIDDLPWLDGSTAEAVDYVRRRVVAERFAIIVATRVPPALDSPFYGAPQLGVTGLPAEQARRLLHHSGFSGPAGQMDMLIAATGGNPLALRQACSDPGQVSMIAAGVPASILSTLEAAYARQFAELDPETSAALLVVAAADQERADVVERACGLLSWDFVRLEAAESVGLIRREHGRIRFEHPLARAIHYNGAPPATRRAVHGALASSLAEVDSTDQHRVLQHQLLAADRPDEALARRLELTGMDAAGRRAYGGAVDLVSQAAALSPSRSDRDRRLVLAAQLAVPAGRLREATRLAQAVSPSQPSLRGEAAHLRARLAIWTGHPREAIGQLVDLARSGLSSEPALPLAEAALASLMVGEQSLGAGYAEEAINAARSEIQAAPGLLMKAFALANVNRLAEAEACLNSSLPQLHARLGEQWLVVAGVVLFELRQLDRAAELLETITSAARSASATEILPIPLGTQSLVEIQRGNWSRAELLALEGLTAARVLGGDFEEGIRSNTCHVALALLDAFRGDVDQCTSRVRAITRAADVATEPIGAQHAERALGLLALGAADYVSAAAHFSRVHSYCQFVGFGETPFLPHLADLIEARAGLESAPPLDRDPLAQLRDTAEAAGTDRDRGLLSRCIALASPDLEGRLAAAREAIELLDAAGDPFESARARLLVGVTLRRLKRRGEAAVWLADAAATFSSLAAAPWLNRCQAELRALGASVPPRSSEGSARSPAKIDLTPQEHQVASLAASGLTNAQIATRMYLSTKTIEYHLGNVYRKLGISRRTELSAVI